MKPESMAKFRIGIVGYGVGRLTAWAFSNIPYYFKEFSRADVELTGICTAHEDTARAALREFDFRFHTTEFERLVTHPDVNVVSVCVPDYLHKSVVLAAIRAGKHVYCEKPMARTVAEAEEMAIAARDSGIVNQMGFQMRFSRAAMQAKTLLEQQLLGDIFSFRCTYQHSGYEDSARPMTWRLDDERAGGGALYDLGSHAVDLVYFLLGDVQGLVATQETFIKRRPARVGSAELQDVRVDDITFQLLRMRTGALGSVEMTRLATGLRRGPEITIHGSRGSLRFNAYSEPDTLELFLRSPEKAAGYSGWERLNVGGKTTVPVEVASQHDFLVNVERAQSGHPDFQDGLRVQKMLEATKLSAQGQRWVDL